MRRLLSVSMVMGIVLSILLFGQAAKATPGTSMSVSLDANRVDTGATFDVRVVIAADVATMAAQCSLSFSPAVLECTGVTVGDFYTADIVIPSPSQVVIDNTQGTVQTMSVTMLGSVPAKTGTFLAYHMRAKAEGSSDLSLSEVKVINASGDDLLGVTVNNGSLSVGPQPVPDLVLTGLHVAWVNPGSTYAVTYSVKNQGDGPAGAFKTGLYVDGAAQLLATENIPLLGASENYTGTFSGHVVQISGAEDTVKVCADTDNVIVESFKNNNCLESVFEQLTYTLRLEVSQGGYVEVTENGANLPTNYPAVYQIALGTQLTVTAVPGEGNEFTDWVGDLSGQPNPATITMGKDYTLQAFFAEIAQNEQQKKNGGLSTLAIAGIIAAGGLVVAAGVYLVITRLRKNP